MKATAVGAALACLVSTQQPTFRSRVDVVTVPVSVTSANRPVGDLRLADFEVADNGVRQQVSLTRLEGAAIDVTILLDVSGSLQGEALEEMKRDVVAIGDELRTSDRVRVIAFADAVETVVPFTSGGAPLPLDALAAGGATSLYAAMASALVVDPDVVRPQLVFVMTDGRDTASFAGADEVLRLAGRSRACLFLARIAPDVATAPEESIVRHPEQRGIYVGVSQVRRTTGPYAGGPNVAALKDIAARTGGAYYDVRREDPLVELFRQALQEFRGSYLLSYVPDGVSDSGWHAITVSVSRRDARYTIRARKGYQR